MFKKIHDKLDSIIGCTNKLFDYIIRISGTLGKLICEADATREEVKQLRGQVESLEHTVSLLQEVRSNGEMEQGIESIMNYGRKVKKDA